LPKDLLKPPVELRPLVGRKRLGLKGKNRPGRDEEYNEKRKNTLRHGWESAA
jgi:hypothetical protein